MEGGREINKAQLLLESGESIEIEFHILERKPGNPSHHLGFEGRVFSNLEDGALVHIMARGAITMGKK